MNGTAGARPALDLRLAAIVALALLAGLLSWLFLDPTDVKDTSAQGSDVPTGVPVLKSVTDLHSFALSTGHPVYWAGAQPGFKYEVTRTPDGRVYIRYLPPEVQAGDVRLDFTFIGTYPQRDALGSVRAAIRNRGAHPIHAAGGGLAVVNTRLPRIVYLAFPRSDYLVEIYDPSPARARGLVTSRTVLPIQ